MANTLRFKRGSSLSNAGTPAEGEPLYNTTTGEFFIGDGSTAASSLTAIGGSGNTWRPVTAGGNSLSDSETLAFTAGSHVTISEVGGAVTIASTDTTYTSSDFTHDSLTGVTANEHIDWTASGAGTIHSTNYTDTTYSTMGSGNSYASGLVPTGSATHGDTYLRKDGSWGTPTDTDTVYTHPTTAGNKHIPSGGSAGQFLKYSSSGTAVWASDNNTTYTSSDFTHDSLSGVTANEHIDWTTDQGTTNIHSGNYTDTNTWRSLGTGASDACAGNDARLSDARTPTSHTHSNYLTSNASDTASERIEFQANHTNSWDTIATTSGSQGCIEIYNNGAGTDAFMTFHVGGDYACYFGLDGGTNKLSVGGWSMGANSYEIYHSGNKPSLATLGFTGASNANYITNNNQLTNGAGYITTANTGNYNTWDDWLRENGDNASFKCYGNTNMMVFRTDGTGGHSGHTGYAFKWLYGGDATGNSRMLLNTSGQLWTSNYGWLHDKFLSLSGGTLSGTVTMGTQNAFVASDYGHGVFGVYSASRYQHVWSMGTAYQLSANGTSTGDLYGIAWTHTNVGGESKSGLAHQMLIMDNGVTKTAIGRGIWTDGDITGTGKLIFNGALHELDGDVGTDTYAGFSWHGTSRAYGLGREGGAWNSPFPDLCVSFHTGVQIGGHTSYSGTRFYEDRTWDTSPSLRWAMNNGDSWVRGYGNGISLEDNSGRWFRNGNAYFGRNHAYNTPEIKGYGAELMIGCQSTDIHINYRTCNSGTSNHTPTQWYWRAGSSSSWSNHDFGHVRSHGNLTGDQVYTQDWLRNNPDNTGVYNQNNSSGWYSYDNSWMIWGSHGGKYIRCNHLYQDGAGGYAVSTSGTSNTYIQKGNAAYRVTNTTMTDNGNTISTTGHTLKVEGGSLGSVFARPTGYTSAWTRRSGRMGIYRTPEGYDTCLLYHYDGSTLRWTSGTAYKGGGQNLDWTLIKDYDQYVTSGGTWRNPTIRAATNGHIYSATGSFNNSSDERLKRNITNLTKGLEHVKQMRPVTYNRYLSDDDKVMDKTEVGFIAQEMLEIGLDEVVEGNNEDAKYYTLNYGGVTAYLVKAMQEMVEKIESLETKIEEMQNGT